MKKDYFVHIRGVEAVKRRLSAILLALLAAMPLSGCAKGERQPESPVVGGIVAEDQLIASAQTREEAERIGALYGITLVDFSAPLALYRTEEDPAAVIRRGTEKGWPQLSINYVRKAH